MAATMEKRLGQCGEGGADLPAISINTHHFSIRTIDPYFNPMPQAMQAQFPSPHFQPFG